MDKKHRGAFSELAAASWLLEQGFEVFRNVSPHGSVDIIARHPKTGELHLIDVKTLQTKYTKNGIPQQKRTPGVQLLVVDEHGKCGLVD